ncbi:hydantoinase/oxoprolinase family protein [Bacillus sp. MRMR6]|uniref:hydantoinase/oxoprolinase family protein n=1 Tax=Bacillus sp. MRMR6 TaxID=1928617 RepID=UPI0009523115|nr:hydantoinase/oxoprolinase family protein [Bacillus sp. MRMR6]OLS33863.1 5-oxoprolinase [Bacillus sp. MRMR6]
MGFRIGIDTGGTFTDVALINENNGQLYAAKVPSTPHNPSEAIIQGMEKILSETGVKESEISFFIHGTTVATNALLEQKGAITALITTEGFKDVLEIGRQTRPKLYDFRARKPSPLIPRHLRVEAAERIRSNGEIITPIQVSQLEQVLDELKRQGVEAISVCLLNSYINDTHERIVKKIIEEKLPHVYVSLSSEVLSEYREFERTSTTVINSYVMPKMKKYLNQLHQELKKRDVSSDLYIMQSNGGIISTETATEVPARTVLSGPAGGAMAGITISQMTGRENLITIDMGGTSLDTCLIEKGQPHFTTMSEIGSMPIKLPMVEMHTIGSGGGSIAWIDAGGALCVGPHSAGAFPGPVCYGRGGIEPTVTDANVILGRLNPDYILGGEMKMDVEAARQVVYEKIAKPLGMSVEKAAEGIIRVVNANMVRGIHVVSVEKGHDPRDFSLVAFGGAGPVNAIDLGMELGCPEIIVPKYPGITCAIGMLSSNIKQDYVQTFLFDVGKLNVEDMKTIYRRLEEKASEQMEKEGLVGDKVTIVKSMDLRYKGQSYELTVSIGNHELNQGQINQTVKEFHKQYQKLYGYSQEENPLEVVNLRLIAIGHVENIDFSYVQQQKGVMPQPIQRRKVYFHGEFIESNIYNRNSFTEGSRIHGPAVIEQLDSTIVVYPKQEAVCDTYGNLVIQL